MSGSEGSEVYALVAFPPPPVWEKRCSECTGEGITGEQYAMPTDRQPLLVDVLCATCGGCGNGDPRHRNCSALVCQVRADQDDWEPAEESCPSCHGREWNRVQAFEGEGDELELKTLRVPCGCTTDRVQLVEAATDVR